jgi:phospholipid/cholesterol/gamma-HCH transport system substrate-binding protein
MTVHHVWTKAAGVGVFLLFGLALFIVLFKGAGGDLSPGTPYTVRVVMPDAFQLVDNADVRRAGVKIGRVSSIESRGSQALVDIEIDDEHKPVYRDAKILLRTKTLVGENYIQLDPGTPRAGALDDGGVVPVQSSAEAVQLDEILSALDRRTRASIQDNLDGLGTGVAGRSRDINELFAAARPAVADGAMVMSILRGQRGRLAELVRDTGRVTEAVASRDASLRSLATSAKRTAQAVAARDAALGQTLEELPSTLAQARSSVSVLQGFAREATPVVSDLQRGFADLRPVMLQLPSAAARTRETFGQLRPFLKVADPMLARLSSFTTALRPTVPALDGLLREAGPFSSYLRPYAPELGAFFANQSAHDTYRDQLGGAVRIFNHVDADTYSGFTPALRKAVDELQRLGALAIDVPRLQENPYPKPGSVGSERPRDGEYPRVTARP